MKTIEQIHEYVKEGNYFLLNEKGEILGKIASMLMIEDKQSSYFVVTQTHFIDRVTTTIFRRVYSLEQVNSGDYDIKYIDEIEND
jgi:hypothetical protein